MNVTAEIRLKTGLNQAEFAKLIKVGRTTVSGYERGARNPSYKVAARYLKIAKNHEMKRVALEKILTIRTKKD